MVALREAISLKVEALNSSWLVLREVICEERSRKGARSKAMSGRWLVLALENPQPRIPSLLVKFHLVGG